MPAEGGRAIFLLGVATYYENMGRANMVKWKMRILSHLIIKLGGRYDSQSREGWKVGELGSWKVDLIRCIMCV